MAFPAIPRWFNAAQTGPFAALPSQDNFTVITPSGGAITEGDYLSHRYHHHTRVAIYHDRVWVAYSSSGTNEDAGGQMVLVSSAPKGATLTFGTPQLAVDKQSTWSATGAQAVAGSFITYPRSFVVAASKLYIVSALDKVNTGGGSNNQIGMALLANECLSDGTLGAVFRCSVAAYTPFSAFSEIAYDATIGPTIYPAAKFNGPWGGSSPSLTASDWLGFTTFNSITFAEPTTIALDGSGTDYLRFWRRITTPDFRLYAQRVNSDASVVGTIYRTSIPDQPSASAGLRLASGRFALVGNPKDVTTSRDPLHLAIFNTNARLHRAYAVRAGGTDTPVYAGSAKLGAYAYPAICEDVNDLYISYSERGKEIISVTRVNGGALL